MFTDNSVRARFTKQGKIARERDFLYTLKKKGSHKDAIEEPFLVA